MFHIFAQTSDADNLIDTGVEYINTLGGVDPAAQLIAGISILLGFMLMTTVNEWRRGKSESAFRNALQSQSNRDQRIRQETDDLLEEERKQRRELEDKVADLERDLEDCAELQEEHTKVTNENDRLKKRLFTQEEPPSLIDADDVE